MSPRQTIYNESLESCKLTLKSIVRLWVWWPSPILVAGARLRWVRWCRNSVVGGGSGCLRPRGLRSGSPGDWRATRTIWRGGPWAGLPPRPLPEGSPSSPHYSRGCGCPICSEAWRRTRVAVAPEGARRRSVAVWGRETCPPMHGRYPGEHGRRRDPDCSWLRCDFVGTFCSPNPARTTLRLSTREEPPLSCMLKPPSYKQKPLLSP